MFLLIRKWRKNGQLLWIFTFHNVSINTNKPGIIDMGFFIFTFHDVSINTHHTASDRGYIPVFTFHDVSINTSGKRSWTYFLFPLHSTMFLLILVSCFSSCALSRTLHSTMFLLIPPPRTDIVNTLSPLHSTMFLLIPLLKCQAFRSVFLYIPRCFY